MKRRNAKLAAYILIGTVALSSVSLDADATGVSSLLPAAGLALTMEEGGEVASAKSASEAKEEKKETKEDKKEETSKAFKKEIGASAVTESASEKETKDTETTVKNTLTAKKEEKKEKEPLIIEKDEKKEDGKSAAKNTGASDADKQETAAEEKLTKEEKEFSKLVIAKVNDYVNIRSIPSEEGEILGKLYDKSVGDFILEKDGWYKITSGSVTGYVKAEYCVTGREAVELAKKVGTRVATVTTTTLKVRESEGLDAPVLGLVPIEEELSVVEELDGWVKVDIEEGYGYVSADYVSLRTDFVKAESKAEEAARLKKEEEAKKAAKEAAKKAEEKVAKEKAEKSASQNSAPASEEQQAAAPVQAPTSGGSGIGNEVVNYAMQFVGNPYVYGGSSLTNGTDCSGFVMSVYKNFGVSLPHSSSADRGQGYDVGGLSNAQPGDIVCYSGHVGIYAGNGKIVHASTSKTGIIVSDANYRKVLAVRRIF